VQHPLVAPGKIKKDEIFNADAAKDIYPIQRYTPTSKQNMKANSLRVLKRLETIS